MRLFSGQLFVRKPILTFVIFTAIVFLHPAWNGNCGEDEAKSEEEKQIDEKIQKFSDQIKSLQESLEAPEKYKEFRKVIEEHNKFLRNKDKEEQNFNSRENDLINLKDVRDWLQTIYDLQSDLSRLYSEKYSN